MISHDSLIILIYNLLSASRIGSNVVGRVDLTVCGLD